MELGKIFTYQKGKSPQKESSSDKEVLYLTPEYLRGNSLPNFLPDFPSKVEVKKNDLLLLWDGSNAGEFFLGKDGVLSSTMVKFFFNENKFNKEFLFYQLKAFEGYLKSTTNGSGIPHVDRELLMALEVQDFDKDEQGLIAEFLKAADGAIKSTEYLISKYQRIKIGLMQDLLERGIDSKGRIRSKTTHDFVVKKGIEVPKEWDVDIIDNLVTEVLDFKANGSFETLTANVKYYYEPNFARLIRLTDLRNGLHDGGVYIDKKGFQFLKKTRLVEGDILISCVGEYTGFVCQMPKVPYQATIAPNMFVVRFKEGLHNSFVAKYMQSAPFQNQILVVSTSSATKLLNNPNLRSLKIVVPPKDEQIEIADRLQSIDATILEYEMSHKKLELIKTGLMRDLMSGKNKVHKKK